MIGEAVTAADLIELSEAHPLLRFELSANGTIEATTTPRSRHNRVVTQLAFWLLRQIPDGQDLIQHATGVRTRSGGGTGYRRPDLALFTEQPPPDETYLDPALVRLVVEVVSRSTRAIDFEEKVMEYAAAGIPHYWIVDTKENAWLHRLDRATGRYRPDDTAVVALADLIARDPHTLLD
jgi:Uma2 family endonuclease